MEVAYTSVDVVKCHVDLLRPTRLATGIKTTPTFISYRNGEEELRVEGVKPKKAVAACEALQFVD